MEYRVASPRSDVMWAPCLHGTGLILLQCKKMSFSQTVVGQTVRIGSRGHRLTFPIKTKSL